MPPEPARHLLEKIALLKGFEALEGTAPETIASLAEHTVDVFYPAGTEIYAEGEQVTTVHYVLQGVVELRRQGRVVATLAGRSVIGGLASMARISDGQQAVALEDVHGLRASSGDLAEVYEDNFDMLLGVLRAVARQLITVRKNAGPHAGFDPTIPERTPVLGELTLVERLEHLRQSFNFAGARIEAIAELASAATVRRAPAGTLLWQQGERSERFLSIVSGVILGRNEAQEIRFGPGSGVGGLDSLAGEQRWYTARCETDVVAIELDQETLVDVLEDNVDMAQGFLAVMARGLIAFRDRLAPANDGSAAVGSPEATEQP